MENIRELIHQLSAMPHSAAQSGAARLLWDRAQRDADPEIRFQAISAVLEAVLFAGETDYFLSLIPQMVRLKREHPEAVNLFTYAWRLKWLAGRLLDFPEIPLTRVREAEQVYADALMEAGGGRRTVLYLRWQNNYEAGSMAGTEELREEFLGMPQDYHADCTACEVNSLVREAVHLRDWDRALRLAEPIVRGALHCAEVPHATFGRMLLPFLALKNEEMAARCHRQGYGLIRSNTGWMGTVGDHLGYLAAIGNVDRFMRLLKHHAGWLRRNLNPRRQLEFFAGAAAGLEMLAVPGSRRHPVKLELPERLTERWGNDPIPLPLLAEYFEGEARRLAAAFDLRNGNPWMTGHLDQTLAFIREFRAESQAAGTVVNEEKDG